MSISAISSTLYAPIYVAPVISASAAAGPSDAVISTVTQVNANGTITKITTYANGTITSTVSIDPNAPPAASPGALGLLNTGNQGQVAVLLAAQAQISTSHLGR